MEKITIIAETIDKINECIPPDTDNYMINKLVNTIAHKAPEIIDEAWIDIYNTCSYHFNNKNIQWHVDILNIYNRQYHTYKNKFL
jgi:hypothetical protein